MRPEQNTAHPLARRPAQPGTDRTQHGKACRCVACDDKAAPWWLGIVAVLVAMVFMAMAGWLDAG